MSAALVRLPCLAAARLVAGAVPRPVAAGVVAAAGGEEKVAACRKLGADEVIDYNAEDLYEKVMSLTDGRGVDVVYDPVGGQLFDQCLRSVAWNGRILIVGFASGTIPQIPANLPLLKGASLVGVFWGRFAKEEPSAHQQNTKELFDFYAKGKIRPKISAKFALEDGAAAIATLAERRSIGKVVVMI